MLRIHFKRNLGNYHRVFRIFLGLSMIAFVYSEILPLGNFLMVSGYLFGLSQVIEGALGY